MRNVTKRITAKGLVLDLLKANGWVASFEIERLSEISPYMASNLSRRARQLVEEGVAEKKRVGRIECFRCNRTHEEAVKTAQKNWVKTLELSQERLLDIPRRMNANLR